MARIRFTAKGIDSLKAPVQGRIEYWDEGLPGFGIRISEQGRKTWVAMYRFNGRLRRLTIGTYPTLGLADAAQRARDAFHGAEHKEDAATKKQEQRRAETFGELAEEYLTRHAKMKKKSWKEDERLLDREFLPDWRTRKAREIIRRDVLLILDKIVDRGAPIQANRALALVRKVFNFAVQRDIIEVNPAWRVATPGLEKQRERVLTEDEIRELWKTLEKEELLTASFYKLLLLTAQRSGELGMASWNEVDLANGWWSIPAERAKNGLPHRVPLSKTALKIVKILRLQSGGAPWIFPSPRGEFAIRERKRCLERIRTASKVEFWPHDLRRTAASYMTGIGIPRLTVSKILNHAEKSVTAVYDRHSYDNEKKEALERWAGGLERILNEVANSTMGEQALPSA